ncbi:MAG: creatininase family protein [Janthinobacterium lividum]
MTMPTRYWHELSWPQFRMLDLDRTVVVLPIAAIEQHGPHLPVFVDACINQGILGHALAQLPDTSSVLALPMQSVGKSDEHLAFPGTLTHSADTLTTLLIELGESVHRAGLRRLVLFNSHGGNPQVLDIVARTLRIRHQMFVVCVSWPRLGLPPGLFDAEELKHGIHGGDLETSVMLHLRPDLVDQTRARNFVPWTVEMADRFQYLTAEGRIGFGWQTQDLHRAGACGNAAAATAEKGRIVVETVSERLIAFLDEVAAYPLDHIRSDIDADA